MKPADKRKIARAIRVQVPELDGKGALLAVAPRGRILRGVCLEGSGFEPRGLYVSVFVQPLFVPATTIVLSLGERLGGGSRTWSVEEAEAVAIAVREQGRPFFGPISSPEALARWSYLDGRTDTYACEARGCALVAAARYVEGATVLRGLARSLDPGPCEWMLEARSRAERLAHLAETSPAKAQELLADWETATIAALRIGKLP